jgi:plasmid maintenance system antidote protein VapI
MKKKYGKSVPAKIKKHLGDNGTKQSWLSEKTGISQAHISNVLANRVLLTDDVLNKINEVLGTDFKIS